MKSKLVEELENIVGETNTTSNFDAPPTKEEDDDRILRGKLDIDEEEEDDEECSTVEEKLESLFSNMIDSIEEVDSLHEISYKEFVKDDTKSDREKVNGNINKMYSKLVQVDRLCTHALKLKGTLDNSQRLYWKQTFNKLNKTMKKIDEIRSKCIDLRK